VLGIAAVICGLAALSSVWLPPGTSLAAKFARSLPCVLATIVALGIASQVRISIDVTEDRRNSFSLADQRVLATLRLPLVVTVNLVPEDPRFADLQRNVLRKLERAMPNVSVIVLAGDKPESAGKSDAYGEIEYVYGNRSDVSRSTSPREILPLLYALAETRPPEPAQAIDYPGYPLVASADATLPWFFGGLPLLIAFAWWWSRRPPSTRRSQLLKEAYHEHQHEH
jgi:ABC-2 type transport system permease protein